jgi:putative ABC transport system ATP-binding protein
MEPRLNRFIWTYTWRQQLYVLFIVVASMIPYYMSFNLPKLIVNGPIQGRGFEAPGATEPFLDVSFRLPLLGGVTLFPGWPLDRQETLFALSMVFLLLVVVNGLFKFYINTYKGRLGERMLRRIRYELVDRILRFPPSQFKRVKAAEAATMVKDEVEPLGGFIGDAFVQPAMLGGQAATALMFIIVQNFWMGMIAFSIVAVQLAIIPRMRRRLLRLGRERQITARELSGRVGEIVDGIGAIHTHDRSNYERADVVWRLGRIFKIRYDLYQWKFLVKFINNFLAQVTPFVFYLLGGFLVLRGRLDVGQLVAVIAAYGNLPGPLKELIDWDQARQDVQVKYTQVVEQFTVEQLLDPELQALTPADAKPLAGPLAAANLSLVDDSGALLLERVTAQILPGEAVAVVSTANGGGEAFAEALGRLNWPEQGRVTAGGLDLLRLPEAVTGRRISYASSDAFLAQGTLGDNLTYGLRHAPLTEAVYEGADAALRHWEIEEARKAGNPVLDVRDNWIDYAAAGASGPDDFRPLVRGVLEGVMLSRDVFDLGLRARLRPGTYPDLVGRVVELRHSLRQRLAAEAMEEFVVPFEPDAYNAEATVGENLLFGVADEEQFRNADLAANRYLVSVLEKAGLGERLYRMGLEIAEQAVELFSDLPPDHPFFQQMSFMTPEEIPEYRTRLQRLQGKPFATVSRDDLVVMISLSFSYIERRYRFGLLDEELMGGIVRARTEFLRNLPAEVLGAIEPYDPARYTVMASVLDNVLFGRIAHNNPEAPERVRGVVSETLEELGLLPEVLDVGLGFDVGVGGRRLTAAQRQKLDVARGLLKRPDYFILNRPLSALDGRAQEQIMRNVLDEARRDGRQGTVVWVLNNPAMSRHFDRVLVFDRANLVQDGTYDRLSRADGVLKGLLSP